jgi:hypothetical protein
MSKMQIKLLVGLGIATVATAALAIGVIRELKAIRNLTIDADELPDELFDEDEIAELEGEAEEEAVEE